MQVEQKKIEAVLKEQQLMVQDTGTQGLGAREATSGREVKGTTGQKTEESKPITESPEEDIPPVSAQADIEAAEVSIGGKEAAIKDEGVQEAFEQMDIKDMERKDAITSEESSDAMKRGISGEAMFTQKIRKPEEKVTQEAQGEKLSQITTKEAISERPAEKELPVETDDKILTVATFIADKEKAEVEPKKENLDKDTGVEAIGIEKKPEPVMIKKPSTEKKLEVAEQKRHATKSSKKGVKPKKEKRVYEKAPLYGEAMLAEVVKSPASHQDTQQAEEIFQKPVMQTEEGPIKLGKNSLELTIEFNVRETEIGAEHEVLLLKFIEMLRDKKYRKIIIEGHA